MTKPFLLYRGMHPNQIPKQAIFVLGNFDGVHLGHQYLFQIAREQNLHWHSQRPIIALTFEPHAQEFFQGRDAPARLTTIIEKYVCFKNLGLQGMWVLPFNVYLAHLSAQQFIESILAPHQPSALIMGADFRFGHQRQGDTTLLEQAGQQYGWKTLALEKKAINDVPVSSTRIREALKQGDLNSAQNLLGKPYFMCGRVIHGNKLGRQLGFPTLNIPIKRKTPAICGIFIVSVLGLDKNPLPGIASLGLRPVVGGDYYLLEVHLLNFSKEVYGARVKVIFHQKCRDEKHFENLDDLMMAMQKDKAMAIEYFNTKSKL